MGAAGVAVLAAVAVLAFGVDNGGSAAERVTGSTFDLPALDGTGTVSLASYGGRPVVVNFFASWCDVCASELPTFARVARAERAAVAFIEVDTLETGNGAAFANRFDLQHSVAATAKDPGAFDGKGLYRFLGGTGGMPLTAFYNPQGRLIATHVGVLNTAGLYADLARYYHLTEPMTP